MDAVNDKLRINLIIAGKTYSLTIMRNEEELIRKAAKLIDVKLAGYATRYNADEEKSQQDFLSMAALEIAYTYLKMKESRDVDMLTQSIRELDEELDGYLRRN